MGLWLTLSVATILLSMALGLAMAEDFRWMPKGWIQRVSQQLARKRYLRNLYIGFVVGIVFVATVVNLVLFAAYLEGLTVPSSGHIPNENKRNCTEAPRSIPIKTNNSTSEDSYIVSASCLLPQYHIYTWVLALMCLASFLKLNYMCKSIILFVMVTVYVALMLSAYPQIFSEIQV